MEMIFRVGRSTADADKCPNGTFIIKDNVKDDSVLIRKNAKRIQVNIGEEPVNMWEYEEWKGTVQDYICYSNDLLNLPSNQLQITFETCNLLPKEVTVIDNDIVWKITLRRNITDNGNGSYSCEKLEFDRPKGVLIQSEIEMEYKVCKDDMFLFATNPESPIQKNITSLNSVLEALYAMYNELDTRLKGGNL